MKLEFTEAFLTDVVEYVKRTDANSIATSIVEQLKQRQQLLEQIYCRPITVELKNTVDLDPAAMGSHVAINVAGYNDVFIEALTAYYKGWKVTHLIDVVYFEYDTSIGDVPMLNAVANVLEHMRVDWEQMNMILA